MDLDKAEEVVGEEVAAFAQQIAEHIGGRQSAALAVGNKTLADKWTTERNFLAAPKPAEALAAVGFQPVALDTLAIYAAQKVRRLVQAYLGTGRIDPYTEAVIKNANLMRDDQGRFGNRLVVASLTTKLKVTETLPNRRVAAMTTAVTQASSSRQALMALGAGRMEGKGRESSFIVDFAHPFVARVLGA